MGGYIGIQPVPQATQTRDTFTAVGGDTSFATGGYTPQFLDVYMNGIHLINGTDYTAANGSDVVLTEPAALGDLIEVVAYSTFEVADTVPASTGGTFSGNVTATAFIGDGSQLTGIQAGAGLFKGENGETGDTTNGAGDIFRINQQTLNTNVTIDADENASCAGPLTLATGVTLTVSGNLTVV